MEEGWELINIGKEEIEGEDIEEIREGGLKIGV